GRLSMPPSPKMVSYSQLAVARRHILPKNSSALLPLSLPRNHGLCGTASRLPLPRRAGCKMSDSGYGQRRRRSNGGLRTGWHRLLDSGEVDEARVVVAWMLAPGLHPPCRSCIVNAYPFPDITGACSLRILVRAAKRAFVSLYD